MAAVTFLFGGNVAAPRRFRRAEKGFHREGLNMRLKALFGLFRIEFEEREISLGAVRLGPFF
jgi:hypothetical protein